MESARSCYTLSNGVAIPCIGFGTYNAKGGDNLAINRTAIEAGYRYFDTASEQTYLPPLSQNQIYPDSVSYVPMWTTLQAV